MNHNGHYNGHSNGHSKPSPGRRSIRPVLDGLGEKKNHSGPEDMGWTVSRGPVPTVHPH